MQIRFIFMFSKTTETVSVILEFLIVSLGCPWRRPQPGGEAETLGELRLQPCVLQLCRFFSQCLCRPLSRTPPTVTKRYCDDSFLWYEEQTFEVCRRVRRVSFSRNLKQRCLSKMCNKL
ncbi:uncharacterized protein LOC122841775 isoform X1 [Gambusia affinis]|uniref:uncharacterized protein LOC122841775 isoform X1 n=1 Tax=Gambusia affinis TaxID=33528 RepID=UPI001CDD4B1E|nr:uncharacterized protein LOC122841775 isoform X1 [Gambusia affinis]